MTELSSELARLRTGGEDLAHLVSARDAELETQRQAIATLQGERTQLREQAEAAAHATRAAESRLAEQGQQVETFQRELRALRIGIDERDARLSEVEAELSSAQEALAESEHAVASARVEATSVEGELATVDDRTPGHVRLIALREGYRLVASEDVCPRAGDHLEMDGRSFVVARIGLSPLPSDKRRCALLLPDR